MGNKRLRLFLDAMEKGEITLKQVVPLKLIPWEINLIKHPYK